MWGSSMRKDGIHALPFDSDARHGPIKIAPERRVRPYEGSSTNPEIDIKPMRMQREGVNWMDKGKETIDCGKFKKDLKDVCML